jgi:hypothetical protein
VREGLLYVLGVWFLSAGQLFAQSLPATNPQEAKATPDANKPADASSAPANASSVSTVDSVAPDRGWARVEYLLWWVKDAPLPVPVVTTGDPRVGFDPSLVNTVNTAGAVGQPGTQILLGDQSIRAGSFSGLRLTLGAWVDEDKVFGVEGRGFALEHRFKDFAAASDKAGNPPLYFPIFSETAGAERAIPIADPLRSFSGDVGVTSTLRLWGAECNGILVVGRNPWLELTLLAGFRYANLRETLQINNTTTDSVFGNVTNLNDSFNTRNQFYGGQIGSRLSVQRDRSFLDISVVVALGSTHQVVDIQGTTTQAGPNPLVPPGLGTFPGGLFAQSTNIGRRSADQFTVLPTVELKLGCDVSHRSRVFVGYEIMYWDQVVRPGDQMNHRVNVSQNAVLDPSGVGKLGGPAQPAPLFNRSDFWAQGVNFGLEFRY